MTSQASRITLFYRIFHDIDVAASPAELMKKRSLPEFRRKKRPISMAPQGDHSPDR
jgi:hypothetical protein